MRLLFIIICLLPIITNAQSVGINTNTPNTSAQLDISSTSKGFLPPRMTAQQRKDIPSPAAGLVVFDTDTNQLFLFNGTVWAALSTGANSNTVIPMQYAQDASDMKSSGKFGLSVSMGDNYAVAGAPSDDGTVVGSGSVYVYKKSAVGGWNFITKLFANDQQFGAAFGGSVKMAGNYIIIGAPMHDVNGIFEAGKVYIFVKGAGDTWTQQTALVRASPGNSDFFGYSVSASLTATGAVVVAGCPNGGVNQTGNVVVYRNVNGAWNFQTLPLPIDLANNDDFGFEVDVDGDYCAIGAPLKDNGGTNGAGAVYVFHYAANAWTQQQKLNGNTTDANFGHSLDLEGAKLIIGAPYVAPGLATSEQAVMYERNGTQWTLNNNNIFYLNKTWGQDVFNYSKGVALDGDFVMVGAPSGIVFSTGGGSNYSGKKGAAYLYRKYSTGTNYFMTKLINDTDPLPQLGGSTLFGSSVSIKNGDYIIGIPGKTVEGMASGAVAFGVY